MTTTPCPTCGHNRAIHGQDSTSTLWHCAYCGTWSMERVIEP